MMLNITLEDTDLLKFNVKNMAGEIIEVIVAYSQFGDSLDIHSEKESGYTIDCATLDLAEDNYG